MDVLIHYQSLGISMCINNNQLTVTCSKSTIETLFSSYPSARVTQKKWKEVWSTKTQTYNLLEFQNEGKKEIHPLVIA